MAAVPITFRVNSVEYAKLKQAFALEGGEVEGSRLTISEFIRAALMARCEDIINECEMLERMAEEQE